ncbi:tyrosine-type recombinase/integrase [Sphingomonas sp.]|jgi:integrase|uniref:tyrosine-type recombinase/integrase n=1 Tax=Sphingomonas sp. TaxID=28214 RepID=UPI002ED7CED1
MLTNAAVRAARPKPAAYKIADERGLHLFVAPNGRKSFRLRFRLHGKEQLLTFGMWPEISLEDARAQAAAAREQLGRGEDPRVVTSSDDSARVRAFEYVCRRWFDHMRPRWTEVHANDVLASLERDVFPAIGAMPIGAITTPVVLNALRSVEGRGRLETARRVRQRISGVFAFAIAEGLVDQDPAAIVGKALMPPAPARHHAALLAVEDARELLAAAELVDAAPAIKLASRFLALTAVRLAAVRGAAWSEIEDLDGAAPLWRIPAGRMKLAAAKKLDRTNDHLVPLSRQAVELLREAHHLAGAGNMIFAGRSSDRPIGEAAIGDLYDRAGFAGRHVPHGWRATFSTILNERFPDDRGQIDRALGHAAGGGRDKVEEKINVKVEGAYNRSQQLAPRRRLFQAWADALVG